MTADRPMLRRPVGGAEAWLWGLLVVGLAAFAVALVIVLGGKTTTTTEVAAIDGQPITLVTYDHWLAAAAHSAHTSNAAYPNFAPDAPSYSRCAAYVKTATTKSGTAAPSAATLLTDCRDIEASLASDVMQILVSGQWILQEGTRQRVTIPAAKIDTSLQSAIKSTFSKGSGLTQFLQSSGEDRSDLRYQVQVSLTAQQLEAQHAGHVPTITAAQISAYFTAHPAAYKGKTLAQATAAIRTTLEQSAASAIVARYLAALHAYWSPRTTCATGYRIAYFCGSGT
jgi:hypothetical protein